MIQVSSALVIRPCDHVLCAMEVGKVFRSRAQSRLTTAVWLHVPRMPWTPILSGTFVGQDERPTAG